MIPKCVQFVHPKSASQKRLRRTNNWVIKILAFWHSEAQIWTYTKKEPENILWRQIDSAMGGTKVLKITMKLMSGGFTVYPPSPWTSVFSLNKQYFHLTKDLQLQSPTWQINWSKRVYIWSKTYLLISFLSKKLLRTSWKWYF